MEGEVKHQILNLKIFVGLHCLSVCLLELIKEELGKKKIFIYPFTNQTP